MVTGAELVKHDIARGYWRELEASRSLLAAGQVILRSWRGRPWRMPTSDGIVTAEIARSNKTFGAVILNCENGFGEQAMMLDRSLFEGMAIAHWVSANPHSAVEMFEAHWQHHQVLQADSIDKLGWWEDIGPRPEPPDPAELKRLEKLFGKYGTKIWTGHASVYALLGEIEGQWEDDGSDLWSTYRTAYRESNLLLHSTAAGLTSTVIASSADAVQFRIGPSEESVPDALLAGHWIYAQTFSLAIDHFGIPGRARFQTVFEDGVDLFRVAVAERNGKIERNDPCPCAKGKKYKHCHGAPEGFSKRAG